MNQHTPWMIYGAYGFTGRWIAEEALRRDMRPILAGRDAAKLEPLAEKLGCQTRVFDLRDTNAVDEALRSVDAVLHCAGPFSQTAEPMLDACLQGGVQYLDITGEIDVIEMIASHDAAGRERGVCLLPAVGFDVVPSDCLAAKLAERLPRAELLQLAIQGMGRVSRGTARTMLENLPRGGRIRRDGEVVAVPLAWKTREIAFRSGRQLAVTIPWGDVASAWHTTGIPNIEVYMAMPDDRIAWLRRVRPLVGLMRVLPESWVGGVLRWFVGPDGASQDDIAEASLWGRVVDADGREFEATVQTPGGYRLTVLTALECLSRVLRGKVGAGFHTPSRAFGSDFVFDIPGVSFRWKDDVD